MRASVFTADSNEEQEALLSLMPGLAVLFQSDKEEECKRVYGCLNNCLYVAPTYWFPPMFHEAK